LLTWGFVKTDMLVFWGVDVTVYLCSKSAASLIANGFVRVLADDVMAAIAVVERQGSFSRCASQ